MNRAKQFSTGSAESAPQGGREDCSADGDGTAGSAESAPQDGREDCSADDGGTAGSAEFVSEQEDPLVRLLRRFGKPVTRENYINLAFLGQPPEMDAQSEAILPPELREH